MVIAFGLGYFLLYAFWSVKNFRLATLFLILLLPAYFIRLPILSASTTILEISWGALALVWLFKYLKTDWPEIKRWAQEHRTFAVLMGLFFIASVAAIFSSGIGARVYWPTVFKAFGLWRAYFFEPMIFFLILIGRKLNRTEIIWALIISTVSVTALALLQKIGIAPVAPGLWDDNFGARVTSFFSSPNAIGLLVAPVMALMVALAIKEKSRLRMALVLSLLLAGLAIFFSFSQGAWVGLFVGGAVLVFLLGYKKIAMGFAGLAIVGLLLSPMLRSAVVFGGQAGRNRLTLWSYSLEYLKTSPQNFLLGTGLRQFFEKIQRPHFAAQTLEKNIYPHNLFLNFWTETGLLGMVAFVGMMLYLMVLGLKWRKTDKIMGAAFVAGLCVLTVHGLVDVPYFKNDLAFLFWIYAALPFI